MTSNPLYVLRQVNQWERSPRGPAAAIVGGWILGGIGITAGAFVTGLVGWLAITAVTSWAMSALMPKVKMGSSSSLSGLITNTREATAPHQIVYGRVRKGGNITFMQTSGDKNKYLHMILVLAGHEVAGIDDIYIDDKKVTWDSSSGLVTTSEWKSKIRIRKFLGNQTTAASELVSECGVSSTFVGNGIAYLYIRMEYDQSVFANGIPTFTAIVRGKKVYDPSTSTTAYSNNAALCIRDYLNEAYGLNSQAFPGSINDTSIITAKNICAQSVTTNLGTETRYPCNVVLSTESTPRENISDLLGSCGGTLFWGQGTWQLKVGSYTTPVENFVLDDLRDSIQIATKSSRKENYNTVSGTFCDEDQDWITVDYPVVKSATFIAEDNGEENTLTADFPAITSSAHAQRMAIQALLRSREQITFKSKFGLKAMKVQPGDNITLTIDRYGWSSKAFEVVSWNLVFEEDSGLSVEMTLKETSASAFNVDGDLEEISSNNTTLPNPRLGLTITNLAVSSSNTIQVDGTSVTKTTVSWTGPTNNLVDYYTVQWKKSTDTSWFSTTTSEESLDLNNLDPGSLYNYRVSVTTVAGFTSSWYTTTGTPVTDVVAPGLPTSITAVGGYKNIQVNWTNPTASDFSHVEIYFNTTNSTSGRTLLGKSTGTFFVHSDLPSSNTRYYWLRSVDFTGNQSGYSSVVSATTTGVAAGDITGEIIATEIADGSITIAKFAADLEPVTIVTGGSLPTTKITENITYNNELYSWNGTEYVKAVTSVEAEDIIGQIASSQIEDNAVTKTKILDGSITTPKLVTGAVVADKIASNAITAGKILAGAVTTDKLAANAVTAGKIAANTITAAEIAAGAITADQIASNAITAKAMAITDYSNPFAGSELASNGVWTKGTGGGYSTVVTYNNRTSSMYLSPATGVIFTYNGKIPVTPGDQYYFEMWVQRSSLWNGTVAGSKFSVRDQSQNLLAQIHLTTSTIATVNTWTKLSVRCTVPTGVTELNFDLRSNATAGVCYISDMVCRRMNGGELIVDGAITGSKILAGEVQTTHLDAGAVTAAKISVSNLSAISANLGTITAGSININNKFLVAPNGTTTIQSSSTGARLVITNNKIQMFDDNNIARLEIGDI